MFGTSYLRLRSVIKKAALRLPTRFFYGRLNYKFTHEISQQRSGQK